ncbi:hypothetical protein FRZ44_37850 [Hypericibacter terrae]|uniref:Uncharacterized protein n=2 Tax=Hypericibacter terrae TaxID=2602015 RepID=A0A5J6MLP3_9PROT|nr:hypothetical protein FRZ44_37850 [Hypericibacter terrae]
MEERRQAAKQRHDFRAEMALTLGTLRSEVQSGFDGAKSSNSRIHSRINAILFTIGGSTILFLLSICGYLFVKASGW